MTRTRLAAVLVSIAVIVLSLWRLEAAREGIAIRETAVGETPVRLYARPEAEGPLVVVAHGFAGSRRMMEGFALTLAAAGYRVAAFDFPGHGVHPVPLSPQVTDPEGGATRQLVDTTLSVAREMGARLGTTRPPALIGHSMASDVVVRAAAEMQVAAVVAVSMYSEAVTADHPQRLLILSGEFEPRLREAALAALRQVAPGAEEGQTVRAGEVVRRAAHAPWVEHIGVLQSPAALAEARLWLDQAYDRPSAGPVRATGGWLLALLAGTVVLAWPLAGLLGAARRRGERLPGAAFQVAVLLPSVLAALAAVVVARLVPPMLPGVGSDGLAAFLLVHGVTQLILLRPALRLDARRLAGALLLAGWALAAFGLALDRYGANFVPAGDRWVLFAGLLPGALAMMLADSALLRARMVPLWQPVLARAAIFAGLAAAVALALPVLGYAATAFPVLLLFFVVFGAPAGWVAARAGRPAAGLGLGVVLAWSLAAAQPIFG